MTADAKQLLLFDLGGVLVEVEWVEAFRALHKVPPTAEEMQQRWAIDPHYLDLEMGKLSGLEFARHVCTSWELVAEPEVFLTQFSGWAKGFLPGALDMLADLRPRYRLAALSNSSEPHWQYMNANFALDSHFERAMSSHHLGLRKPDLAIYERALSELDVAPASVVFFDDRAENVEGARKAGIEAYHVAGVESLRQCLRELGCLT